MIGVADLAAVLTAAGVTIYVLGLIGIYISIRRNTLRHTSTAWYVTSLVPRTVVAGHGVRIWLGLPLFFTVVGLLIVGVTAVVRTTWLVQNTYLVLSGFTLAIFGFIWVYTLLYTLLIRGQLRWSIWLVNTITQWVGAFSIGLAAALFSKGLGKEAGKPAPGFVWIDSIQNVFLVGGVLLFVGAFFCGVTLAMTIVVDLPFPRVRIALKDEGVTLKGVRLEGQLVAHSDGFWHLFSDKDKEFLSIPDERVLAVRIQERGAEPMVDKWILFLALIATIGPGIWIIIWLTTRDIWGFWGYAIGGLVMILFAGVALFAGYRVRKRILRHHSQNKRGEAE